MDQNRNINNKQEDFITVTDLWNLCRSHWYLFLMSFGLCFGLAVYYLWVTPKLYTREAAVLVKLESNGRNSTSKNSEDFNDLGLVQQSTNINNVERHLQSLDVAMEVVSKLDLAKGDDVLPRAERVLKNLKVQIEDDKSTVINLKYTSTNPSQAEDILSTLVQVYNEKWIEDKNSIATNTSQFINDRLALLADELEGIDDSISVFKSRNQITDLNRVSDIYLQQQSQSEAQILALSNQKAMAEYIQSVVSEEGSEHQLLPTNSGISNQLAESQIAQYNAQILQIRNHLAYTSSQNPLIGNMEEELASLRNNIRHTIENHIKTLDIQLKSMYGYSGDAAAKITSNPGQAKRLTAIERQQKVKESLYLYLLQKKEENAISLTYTSHITKMIDVPHGSKDPTSPNKRNVVFVAFFFGLLIPVVYVFVRANMDNTVRGRHDLESKTSIPLVGDVPYCTRRMLSELLGTPFPLLGFLWRGKNDSQEHPIVVSPTSSNLVNEAFRVIRTNLEFMSNEGSHTDNVYIITSNNADSGKTFVSMNLSITMAIACKRVLFIDADLRHASASDSWFGEDCDDLGLSDFLSGKVADVFGLLRHHPEYPTFDILPVGTTPPNPTELLSSEKLGWLVSEFRTLYDYIFIDCPPTENLADATILERHADRTLMVIRAGVFDRSRLSYLENEYKSGKYKHISLILNGTKPARNAYDSSYHGRRRDERKRRGSGRHIVKMMLTEFCLSAVLSLLSSCNGEVYSEYERVKTSFLERINGNIDGSQYWRTAVRLNVSMQNQEETVLNCYVYQDGVKYLTDRKVIPAGGGHVAMTVPQGMGEVASLNVQVGNVTKTLGVRLTGAAEQNVMMNGSDTKSFAGIIGTFESGNNDYQMADQAAWSSTRANSVFNPSSYATHDPNPSLYGKSICGGGYYTEWNLSDWHDICDLAMKSNDLELSGEVVNYELISKGKFAITLLCGYKMIVDPRIFGYYYHSPGTYDDIKFVDMFDTHKYDFLDGKGLVQYQVADDDNWYSMNFQIGDNPGNDSLNNFARRGDNVFNSIYMSRTYRDCITKVRGLSFDIDVPVGMRIGFYMRQDDLKEPEQYNNLLELGLPAANIKIPFKATNFSVKKFNIGGTHRSWVHDCGHWYFMGLEDIVTGGDFDDNDMMFGITDPIGLDLLPEIVDPDIDNMQDEFNNLPWTLAFEDVYRGADFDFNDGVIRITPDYEKEQACITVLAAGTDQRAVLHYEAPDGSDIELGELHELLGQSPDHPVNTTGTFAEIPGVQIDCVPWPKSFRLTTDASRFWLEVFRGDCNDGCSEILALSDNPGQLPLAILVAGEWKWPREGISINTVYPYFNYWAKDVTKMNYWEWYTNPKQGTFVSY